MVFKTMDYSHSIHHGHYLLHLCAVSESIYQVFLEELTNLCVFETIMEKNIISPLLFKFFLYFFKMDFH